MSSPKPIFLVAAFARSIHSLPDDVFPFRSDRAGPRGRDRGHANIDGESISYTMIAERPNEVRM
jgi:hypothetical protein